MVQGMRTHLRFDSAAIVPEREELIRLRILFHRVTRAIDSSNIPGSWPSRATWQRVIEAHASVARLGAIPSPPDPS